MFYDIVFFLSPEAVALGAKVSLQGGKYVITKAQQTTIQAVVGYPPKDDSALVLQLQSQVTGLQGQVTALETKIANALAAVA